MFGSNCCFLSCIQVSHKAGNVDGISCLFKNFPQLIVIHTIKGFCVVNEAEVDFLLKFSCFFYDPTDVGNLFSGFYAFSKSNLHIWKFSGYLLLKPTLKDFEHFVPSMCNECNCVVVENSLPLSFFGIGMKTDLYQSRGHCWVFQISWNTECNTFSSLSFRIWNSSAGIPSPPLAMFIVMLPKAHLTSPSRISGFKWVIRPSLFSGWWRSFLYSSSVYFCHLFWISSASVSPYYFCPLLNSSLH